MQEKFAEEQALNSSNAYRIGPMRRRNPRARPDLIKRSGLKVAIKTKNGDASFFVSDIGLGDSANSDWLSEIT